MSDEKIAEIRKRHAFADEHKSVIRPSGFSWTIPGWQAHNDRATLLAEIERLRAEKDLDASSMVLQRQEIERLTRERAEARAEVERLRAALKPFSEFYLWPDDAGEWTANDVRSDEDWDEERNDAKTDDVFIKRGHIRAARKALEAKS